MREIKFRAWDETTAEMFYEVVDFHVILEDRLVLGYDAGKEHPTVGHGDWVELTLMQYTGLKDKNGKEIYEGDILKDSSGFMWVVIYDNEYACFKCVSNNNNATVDPIDNLNMEVIGNIHENPELL